MSAPMRRVFRQFLQIVRVDNSITGCQQNAPFFDKKCVRSVYCGGTTLDGLGALSRKYDKHIRHSQRTNRGDKSSFMFHWCNYSSLISCYKQSHYTDGFDGKRIKSRNYDFAINCSYCNFVNDVKSQEREPSGAGDSKSADKSGKPENIYTIPNLLTLSRIVMTPMIGYLVVNESYSLALGFFTIAGLTDLLDGYIARNFKNQMSAFGTALDPLADKILITVLTVTLTCANLLPYSLAGLIIGRDILLILTGFVIRYMSLPPPLTFKRYFDATNPTAKLLPSTLSKFNTCLQLSLVCFTLAAPVFDFVNHPALQCLWFATAASTFGSGLDYLVNRKAYVQYLNTSQNTTP